jgi:hypothetical protein
MAWNLFFIVKVDKKWQLLQNLSGENKQKHILNHHSLVLQVLHYKKIKFYYINRATVSMVNQGIGLPWLGIYFLLRKLTKMAIPAKFELGEKTRTYFELSFFGVASFKL